MKKVITKRLVYTNGAGEQHIGAYEYSGSMSNSNILGAVHEIGKTQWIGSQLWLFRNGIPIYHITVETFVQYQKTWFERVMHI